MASEHHDPTHRRPAALDLVAAGLLLATVVLHVVAMFPTYFTAGGSLAGQTDQAALYAVLAATWALVLAVGLTGPHRTPVAAGLAVGVALTEMGFRGSDLGDAAKYGSGAVGTGLWLMEAAWVAGAAGAVVAVLAARSRHSPRPVALDPTVAPPGWTGSPDPYAEAAASGPAEGSTPAGRPDVTTAIPLPDPTSAFEAVTAAPGAPSGPPLAPVGTDEDAHERLAWTVLVALLGLLVAGAFLPAWDHGSAVSALTGQGVSRNLGNAFSGPWEQVVGTVAVAAALAVVPAVAIRMRNKAVGTAAVVGSLLVLASQLVAAVVQVGLPVSPAELGLTPAQVSQLDLVLQLRLTGWFTVDALAAYALFAAVMVWSNLKPVQENSPGTRPTTPEVRSTPIPWAS